MTRASASLHRPTPAFDLLRVPGLGRLLRWRWGRLVFQAPLAVIAAVMIYDGLTGPKLAPQNLATVATWVHYRGLVVLALLVLLLGGTAVAAVLAALALVMRRRYHAAAARHAVESATHERAVRAHAAARAFWEGLRFCACEEVVWDPRTRERFAADMLQRRVRDVGERAVSGRA